MPNQSSGNLNRNPCHGEWRLWIKKNLYDPIHEDNSNAALSSNLSTSQFFIVRQETHPDSIKPNITAAQEMHIAENIRDRLLRRTCKVPNMVKTAKQKQPICKGSWDLPLDQVKTISSKLEVLSVMTAGEHDWQKRDSAKEAPRG